MPVVQESELCDIPSLAADAAANGLNDVDEVTTQAAIVYLLALTIKALGRDAPDYTDVCALARSMQQYDGLPDYARNAARLEAWSEVSENTTGEEVDWDALKQTVACAHCCDITKVSLENSMTFLLCQLAQLLQGV